MTWICYRGIELSARIQQILLSFEFVMLVVFAVVALVKVYSGSARCGLASTPDRRGSTRSTSEVRTISGGAAARGVPLLGLGLGRDGQRGDGGLGRGPGRAAVISTLLLVAIYVLVSTRRAGLPRVQLPRRSEPRRHPRALGQGVLGSPVGQAPDRRGADLGVGIDADDDPADGADDAVDGARGGDPARLRQVHPRYLTPTVSTWRSAASRSSGRRCR